MHNHFLSLRRGTGLICAGAALALPAIRAAAADAPSEADAFPTFQSYIKVSGEAPFITGDSAAFATRNGLTNNTGSLGIEDLFYTKDVNDSTTLKINGKALDGADDYLGNFSISKDNVGSIDVGYKRFRTFYDGVGGFFPMSDTFEHISPESLHVDRSSFWIDMKLARPDAPVFTISFRDEIRTGEKDSSEWAAIINPNAVVTAGALVGTAAPANTPYIAPNIDSLAEHHKTFDASMVASIGKATDTFKVTLDGVSNLDTRYYTRYPISNVIADPTVTVLDDQELTKSTSFIVMDKFETPINRWLALELGFNYHHLSGTDGGQWITPAYSSTLNVVYNAATASGITADPKMDDFVGNAFLKFTPVKDLLADVGFRQEYNVVSDSGGFYTTSLATGATSTAASNFTVANDATYSHTSDHVATPEVNVQYLGISRLTIYGNFDERINHGNQNWINPYAYTTTTGITGAVTTAGAPIGSVFFQQANQDYENAKLGANWNVSSMLTVRADVFRKDHQNRFVGSDGIIGTASYGALYATGYTFTGVNLNVIFKPVPQLSFTTRYQPQFGNMSVVGNTVTGGDGTEVTSGKARTQKISETVDWSPYKQLYFQGSINVVYDYLETAFPVVVESLTTNIATPIQNANNNYISGTALCGFAFDKLTDAQIQGSWQQATNYNPQIAAGGQPFGASFLIESVTVGVKHKFADRLFGDAKVGYLRSTDATTGNFTNYHGPLAYVSVTYSL